MSIQLKNISKRYGDQLAVKNVNFQINSGEIVGFIGPNGAGKSTTMKIITGFLAPTSGQVKINGLRIPHDLMEIKKIIGYLPENNPLYQEMYVREYLEHVANLYGLSRGSARAKVSDIIDLVGLSSEQHKKIDNLSKGYRQRVGLSQALIHDPKVLILDEPTSGLDPNQIVEIRNLISTVGKEKTVILSTHIMQEVEAICDRVIIIDNGEIKADDKTAQISNTTTTGQTIQIELKEHIHADIWKELVFISDVRELPENTFLLASNDAEDVRSEIFNFAVKNKLTILSMNLKSRSMEEVFRDLTSRKS